jgi:hypothetical protein
LEDLLIRPALAPTAQDGKQPSKSYRVCSSVVVAAVLVAVAPRQTTANAVPHAPQRIRTSPLARKAAQTYFSSEPLGQNRAALLL